MEQDGGGVPPTARVVATQPGRLAANPQVSAAGLGQPRDLITLTQPRPGVARKLNEYIETPLRPPVPTTKTSPSPRLKQDVSTGRPPLPSVHRPGSAGSGSLFHHTRLPVTSQPAVATFKKEKPSPDTLSNGSDATTTDGDPAHGDSIICRQCRRCKCEACRGPRHLPSRWICQDKCLCSAPAVVDYCSCMCCVKGLFYHWAKDYEMDNDVSCADQPCSCSPHKRFLRWGCLGLLAVPLPCLWFYWPLRGALKALESCYTECTAQGCRCNPPHRTAMPTEQAPEKRLLDSNSDC